MTQAAERILRKMCHEGKRLGYDRFRVSAESLVRAQVITQQEVGNALLELVNNGYVVPVEGDRTILTLDTRGIEYCHDREPPSP